MGEIITFPGRARSVALTPELRAALEGAAQAALDVADRIITVLDQHDGDADHEDGGDDEPSLGAPEGHVSQLPWARGGDHDLEAALSRLSRTVGAPLQGATPEGSA